MTSSEAAVFHSSPRPLNSGVLLKTATATVTSGSMSAVANVMLDEGCQRSVITEELAKGLHLPRQDREIVHLSAFGDKCNKVMHMDTATVKFSDGRPRTDPHTGTYCTNHSNSYASQTNTASVDIQISTRIKISPSRDRRCRIHHFNVNRRRFLIEDSRRSCHQGRRTDSREVKVRLLLSGPVVDHNSDGTDHVMNVNIFSRTADELSLERFWKLESM